MHASIALFMMMIGGPIVPEPVITTVPLKDDVSAQTPIQELEYQEWLRHHTLPLPPTTDHREQSANGGRPYPYPPTDRKAPQAGSGSASMPVAPTSQEAQHPYQPGGGYSPPGQVGGGYSPAAPRNDPYANIPATGHNGVVGYTGAAAPTASPASNVNQYNTAASPSVAQIQSRYGLSSSSPYTADPMAGNKPFSNYQPPSGYSVWNNLLLPSNNGMTNQYNAYVQPAMNQGTFNTHISEQINGVQTMQRSYGAGTPGMEVPMGGNGLVNPQSYLDVGSH